MTVTITQTNPQPQTATNWATLDEVKHHLRYDDCNMIDDYLLEVYLQTAQQAIRNYITCPLSQVANDPTMKTATLMLCGFYDNNRVPTNDTALHGDYVLNNYLPAPVQALLIPYRKPTAI